MKYVVSLSGGLASFMTTELLRRDGKDFDLVFCDTLSEAPDLYRFLDDQEKYFGKTIVRLSQGMNIWQAQYAADYQANSRKDPCSRILKREPFKAYMKKNYKPEEATIVIGIGSKEKHRTKDFQHNHAPFAVIAPLTEMEITNDDIAEICENAGFQAPEIYNYDFPHNNCGGFCVKAGQKQAAMLLKHKRETYLWHERKQEAVFELMDKKHPTIRKVENGEMTYYSLREFRAFLEAGGAPDLYDEGTCACF
jgi:3'-phosphoadenosine 5'-phosphosulfate sulfotransferase (PAPS reductase)/FAD synthetase